MLSTKRVLHNDITLRIYDMYDVSPYTEKMSKFNDRTRLFYKNYREEPRRSLLQDGLLFTFSTPCRVS